VSLDFVDVSNCDELVFRSCGVQLLQRSDEVVARHSYSKLSVYVLTLLTAHVAAKIWCDASRRVARPFYQVSVPLGLNTVSHDGIVKRPDIVAFIARNSTTPTSRSTPFSFGMSVHQPLTDEGRQILQSVSSQHPPYSI